KPTAVQTLSAIIQDEPEPIQKLSPKTPLPFVWLVERCLAKDPEERYAATRDLARDLRNLRDYLSVAGDNLEGSGPVSPMTPIETRSIPAAEGAPQEAAPRAPRRPASRANPTLPVGGATTVLPSEPGQPRATTPTATPSAPSAHAVSAPRPSKASRAGTIAGFVLGGIALLAGGAYGGYLLSQQKTEAPSGQWTGELLLGGASRAFAPTISPDGKTLAFVTLVDGVAQVAVMTPGSGDWDVRTKQRSLGSVGKLEWSPDGSRIFFDRVTDVPRGIFSIPAVGGETERVVLEEAQSPVPLPDGSLLVVRVDAGRNYQIARFRPDTGKTEPVGPSIVRETPIFIVRAFNDGKEAVFFGRLAEGDTAPQRRAFILDLATGKAKPFAPDLHINPPFALTPSGLVIADVVTGDLHQLVSISRTGDSVTRLLPLAAKPRSLSAGQDGSLYVGLIDDPVDLLRFPLEGGAPEVLAAAPRNIFMHPVRFADGRSLLPTFIAGKRRLLVGAPGQPLKPFIETGDQTAPPVAPVGADTIAYVAGGTGGSPPVIALASVRDGRLVKRLDQTAKAVPSAMAATPDGRTLYYVDGGFVSSVNVESGVVTKVRPGNGIAIDPRTFDLVVQMNEKDGVKLVRVGAGGETPVPFTSTTVRISSEPLSPGAFLPDGRLVVTVTSADSWFVGPAILNPETGEVLPIAVRFDGDVTATTWSGDALLAMGVGIRSELWRFRLPVSSEKAVSAP
ncbi:MAG: PD40 domain-containing protein, partial [Acidobacteria bacterium]|nr:PD40 domain-containing protein [Acidobacteriota bacterium]